MLYYVMYKLCNVIGYIRTSIIFLKGQHKPVDLNVEEIKLWPQANEFLMKI